MSYSVFIVCAINIRRLSVSLLVFESTERRMSSKIIIILNDDGARKYGDTVGIVVGYKPSNIPCFALVMYVCMASTNKKYAAARQSLCVFTP